MKSIKERFEDKYIPEPNSGCHLWIGAISPSKNGKHPYGLFTWNGKVGMAHRFAYEQMHGKIPDGLVLDHLCRTTLCVNPFHLEAVTPKENTNRGIRYCSTLTHCPAGHPYSGDNLYVKPNGHRCCRICRKEQMDRWYKNNRKRA